MVSSFGRGFESHQLHPYIKKLPVSLESAAFLFKKDIVCSQLGNQFPNGQLIHCFFYHFIKKVFIFVPLKDNLLYLRYYLTNKKHTIKISKKFTSVLVLTAAALLSLPVQAQTFTKKAAVDATHLKVQQKFTSKQ